MSPRCETCRDSGYVTTVTQYFGQGEFGKDRITHRTDPCPHCDMSIRLGQKEDNAMIEIGPNLKEAIEAVVGCIAATIAVWSLFRCLR